MYSVAFIMSLAESENLESATCKLLLFCVLRALFKPKPVPITGEVAGEYICGLSFAAAKIHKVLCMV